MRKAILDRLWYYFIGLPACFAVGAVILIKLKLGSML
jgi:hypothetical protein